VKELIQFDLSKFCFVYCALQPGAPYVQGRIKGGNGGNCPGPSASRGSVITFICFK